MKPRDSSVSLQEIQRTEEHVKLYHGDAIHKIQTGKLQGYQSCFFRELKKNRAGKTLGWGVKWKRSFKCKKT